MESANRCAHAYLTPGRFSFRLPRGPRLGPKVPKRSCLSVEAAALTTAAERDLYSLLGGDRGIRQADTGKGMLAARAPALH